MKTILEKLNFFFLIEKHRIGMQKLENLRRGLQGGIRTQDIDTNKRIFIATYARAFEGAHFLAN